MAEIPSALKASLEGTKVEYRRLGKSGLHVSVPILGAMSIGSSQWGSWVIEEDKAIELLNAAFERGLNTWDTANLYSGGTSEEIIGKAIRKHNIPRHKLVLCTKCWGPVSQGDNTYIVPWREELRQTKDYVNQFGLSRNAIFSAVDDSLKRLGTDYIDLYQVHRFDPYTPIEETMEALHDLVKSGKVRYIGASSMWTYQFAMMQFCAEKNGWTKFISMQNKYSLLFREEEREMNRYCNETGVGLIPYATLEAGLLCRPVADRANTFRGEDLKSVHLTQVDTTIINRVEELAKKKGWSMAQVALSWANSRVSSPIVGFSSVRRVDDAVAVRGKVLTEEEEKYLEEPYQPKAVSGFL